MQSFDRIDFSALKGVGKMITDILSDENTKNYMEENRINTIAESVERRIEAIEAPVKSKTRKEVVNNDDEVGNNVAASYGNK